MKLIVTIETDNAAFAPDGMARDWEIARILGRLSTKLTEDPAEEDRDRLLEPDGDEVPLFDVNGNRVGSAVLVTGETEIEVEVGQGVAR